LHRLIETENKKEVREMKLHVLVGQRKCNYVGQHAPEALAVADEYTNYKNPDYLLDEYVEYNRSDDFDALTILTITVPNAEVRKRLYPVEESIEGKVED
jgi:hypothetical protein